MEFKNFVEQITDDRLMTRTVGSSPSLETTKAIAVTLKTLEAYHRWLTENFDVRPKAAD